MAIIETHNTDKSDQFIQLYNEGKSKKEILDTLQIGKSAYNTYLRDTKQHLQKPTLKCPVCGKQFIPTSSNPRYCTEECVKEVKRRSQRKYYQQNRETIIAKTQAYYQQKKKENGG